MNTAFPEASRTRERRSVRKATPSGEAGVPAVDVTRSDPPEPGVNSPGSPPAPGVHAPCSYAYVARLPSSPRTVCRRPAETDAAPSPAGWYRLTVRRLSGSPYAAPGRTHRSSASTRRPSSV